MNNTRKLFNPLFLFGILFVFPAQSFAKDVGVLVFDTPSRGGEQISSCFLRVNPDQTVVAILHTRYSGNQAFLDFEENQEYPFSEPLRVLESEVIDELTTLHSFADIVGGQNEIYFNCPTGKSFLCARVRESGRIEMASHAYGTCKLFGHQKAGEDLQISLWIHDPHNVCFLADDE